MKILDISSVTDTSEIPIKKGTLQFIQDAYKEIVNAALQSLRSVDYNPTTVYILYGIINSGTGPFYSISAGAVFYQGEIYLVDAANFTALGANVAIFQIVTTQYTTNADPTTFTDNAVRNVHNIRKASAVQGISGSGVADYSQAKRYFTRLPANKNPEMYIGDPADFDVLGIGMVPDVLGYALADGQDGRPDMRGMFTVGLKPADADFGTIKNTGGDKTKNLSHTHTVSRGGWGTASGLGISGNLLAGPNDGGASWAGNDRATTSGGSTTQDILPPFFVVMYVVRLY